MKRVKILIASGAMVVATATAIDNNVSQEQFADTLLVQKEVNAKIEHEGICWKTVRSAPNTKKTVLIYQGEGRQPIRIPGRRTLFSQRGDCCKGK